MSRSEKNVKSAYSCGVLYVVVFVFLLGMGAYRESIWFLGKERGGGGGG